MRPTREMRPRPFISTGLGQAITATALASNSLALGNVVVQNAAGSNYHFVSTSSNSGIWVPHEDSDSETPIDHGNMGATETIDVGQGEWHRGTLNANVAITVTGFTVDSAVIALLEFTQDGTGGWDITWDPDVDFSGDDQPDQTASSVTFFLLFTSRGNATVYGAKVGGGSSLTVQEEGVSLSTAATTLNFVCSAVTASGTGATKTITVSASAPTAASLQAMGVRGELLLKDGASAPPVFDDILVNDDLTDFLYADLVDT